MLALPPLKAANADDRDAAGGFSVDAFLGGDDDCFLDTIDFSCIFEGFDFAGDLLPELEIPEPPAGVLSDSSAEIREEQDIGSPEISPANLEKSTPLTPAAPMTPESRRATPKHSHGKKKIKVDWTPELHRRFVTAVEELGVDKAVPSRILEIMGNHNLTRHNVASHLQKYRSHRKHSLAREAEAGSWSHRRQIYAATVATGDNNDPTTKNKQRCQWVSPTVGYPPPSLPQPQFGPLHVWGHPTVDRPTLMRAAMWQGHTVPFQCPQPPWPQPQNYIAYWRPHFHTGSGEGWGPNAVTPVPHFMPQTLPGMRYAAPMPVAGVHPQPVYRPHHFLPLLGQHHPQQNAHPSKESIDAAIGDVLAKPWLPLPLGLKPPSTESVLGELQRHGVPKVPPPPPCNHPEAC